MQFKFLLSFIAAALATEVQAQAGACTLANVNFPASPSIFKNGDFVQVSTTRTCRCENGEFVKCRAPIP
eukprot:Pgem_evm1s9911